MSGDYAPFDQDRHLSDPPWKPDDPALVAWEAAHGHDVRLKCYPEFGCRVIEAEAERIRQQWIKRGDTLVDAISENLALRWALEDAGATLEGCSDGADPLPIAATLREGAARARAALAATHTTDTAAP